MQIKRGHGNLTKMRWTDFSPAVKQVWQEKEVRIPESMRDLVRAGKQLRKPLHKG